MSSSVDIAAAAAGSRRDATPPRRPENAIPRPDVATLDKIRETRRAEERRRAREKRRLTTRSAPSIVVDDLTDLTDIADLTDITDIADPADVEFARDIADLGIADVSPPLRSSRRLSFC